MKKDNNQTGLIRLIVLVVVAVLVLSYFRIDLRNLVNSDLTQSNFGYIWEYLGIAWNWLVNIWQNYISGPFFQTLDRYR